MTSLEGNKRETHDGIFLMCCERVIEQDIGGGATQKQVALTYAMAMQSHAARAWECDWPRINKAILAKWKMSGLEHIKKLAFDYASGKKQP